MTTANRLMLFYLLYLLTYYVLLIFAKWFRQLGSHESSLLSSHTPAECIAILRGCWTEEKNRANTPNTARSSHFAESYHLQFAFLLAQTIYSLTVWWAGFRWSLSYFGILSGVSHTSVTDSTYRQSTQELILLFGTEMCLTRFSK